MFFSRWLTPKSAFHQVIGVHIEQQEGVERIPDLNDILVVLSRKLLRLDRGLMLEVAKVPFEVFEAFEHLNYGFLPIKLKKTTQKLVNQNKSIFKLLSDH